MSDTVRRTLRRGRNLPKGIRRGLWLDRDNGSLVRWRRFLKIDYPDLRDKLLRRIHRREHVSCD